MESAIRAGARLEVTDLQVSYGTEAVLERLSFALEPGEIGCLLGHSGCGKTTALRAIAGFVRPSAGQISIDDQVLVGPNQFVDPQLRGIGVVFQDFALFPHLTVRENIGFGLKGWSTVQKRERVDQLIELTSIRRFVDQLPHELSGGQQQRVALARALAPQPRLLLLDEPFSSLDPDLRERLASEVRLLLKASATTALLVTHDQYEAFAMADKIGVMRKGVIQQWDRPYELYHQPATVFVADFVGQGVWLEGQLVQDAQGLAIDVELGRLPIGSASQARVAQRAANDQGRLRVLLRPDDVIHDDQSPVQAQVVSKAFRGAEFIYTLRMPGGSQLLALVPSHHDHATGEHIGIRFNADHVVAFALEP
jgi:iron(III) transport system ATP-binding protein